jgi:UDP-N-acetylglucosamine diphosphorylase/glucosamine-1-phosphate N-acetyltransferase
MLRKICNFLKLALLLHINKHTMQFVLVDIADREKFYPFSLTQSVAQCRIGIYSFQERWEHLLNKETAIYTVPYLQKLYDNSDFLQNKEAAIFINVTCIPTIELVDAIVNLKIGEKIISKSGKWIATYSEDRTFEKILLGNFAPITFEQGEFVQDAIGMLQLHTKFIENDFTWVKKHVTGIKIDTSNKVIQPENIFIEKGAEVHCAILNASTGPIYIGKNAMIMEGTAIRGPFVLGEKGVVKMNTSIYGATTIGPYCLAGGEIKNSVLMGFSNKGHEGYLGDSIIGHWCNLGAGTCNSNIKNTAGPIQMWNEAKQIWETVGQKMGMLVGDYSRFAIQSSINTGSYIGVSANIFGNGLLPKFIPNFTWGIVPGYQIDKAIEDIDNWKQLKGFVMSEEEKQVLQKLYKKAS